MKEYTIIIERKVITDTPTKAEIIGHELSQSIDGQLKTVTSNDNT